MLLSLDLETTCNVPECPKKGCEHALRPHTARITVIGVWSPTLKKVFRDGNGLTATEHLHMFLVDRFGSELELLGHNLKFDLKMLKHNGLDLTELYIHDTQIAAHVNLEKVSEQYLAWYRHERSRLNKLLPEGYKHREGKPLSLKVLAPYFCGVPAFWESVENHDNDEYVLKDAEYTYLLKQTLETLLKEQDLWGYYTDFAMPNARELVWAEIRGIRLDLPLMAKKEAEASKRAVELKDELDQVWKPAYIAYRDLQINQLKEHYKEKTLEALKKLKKPTPKRTTACLERYATLFRNACSKVSERINLDSPSQLLWLLRDYYKLEVENTDGDESTGKAVLETLSYRPDIKLFLEYRRVQKLCTSFFPTYRDMQVDGILHCNFNMTGTKTGRLSSSGPNLQQVPGDLHEIFIARPGYKLITRDANAIEPRLIAYYTEDAMLVDLMLRDGDFHSANAIIQMALDCDEKDVKKLYPAERKVSKTEGLAVMYGARKKRIFVTALQHGFNWPLAHCQTIFENFRAHYHEVFAFKEEIDGIALQEPITNYFGAKRRYEDPEDIYMQAFNSLVQGTASMLIQEGARRAMTELRSKCIDAHLLLLVHDELVFECPEAHIQVCEEIIERHMTSFPLPTKYGNIPLRVEGKTSDCWAK